MSENTSKTSNAKTFAERAATEPTALHKAFAAWIEAQTGYKPDLKTVQIACALRMDFQRSEENQDSLKARKEEAAKAKLEAAAKRKAKLLAELAKLEGATTEPAEPVKDEAADAPQAPAQPDAPEAKETPSEPAEEPKRPVRRRRAAAAKAAE